MIINNPLDPYGSQFSSVTFYMLSGTVHEFIIDDEVCEQLSNYIKNPESEQWIKIVYDNEVLNFNVDTIESFIVRPFYDEQGDLASS